MISLKANRALDQDSGQQISPNTNQTSPKTNEDFNKKSPRPEDKELHIKKTEPLVMIKKDELLDDESTDPGDADGNGNLINEYDDEGIEDQSNTEEEIKHHDTHIDFKSNSGIKNPDSREL